MTLYSKLPGSNTTTTANSTVTVNSGPAVITGSNSPVSIGNTINLTATSGGTNMVSNGDFQANSWTGFNTDVSGANTWSGFTINPNLYTNGGWPNFYDHTTGSGYMYFLSDDNIRKTNRRQWYNTYSVA
ncbi:MAG: hypothetical protein IPI53_11360 [Saprospiraceae bacterium]|nr:hypothetical protein [Saprospiraceae bacterium]